MSFVPLHSEGNPAGRSLFELERPGVPHCPHRYAVRYREKFDEDADLVGPGLPSLATGISGTFVINGSPTKTEMVDSAMVSCSS